MTRPAAANVNTLLAGLLVFGSAVPGVREWLPARLLPEHAILVAVLALMPTTLIVVKRVSPAVLRGFVLLALWLTWGLAISVARSPRPSDSLTILGWQAASLLAPLLVAALYSRSGPTAALRTYVASAVFAAGVGIVAFSVGWRSGPLGVNVEVATGETKAVGLSVEANLYGALCALALVVLLVAPSIYRIRWRVCAALLLFVGLVLSFTRAAWAATVLAFALAGIVQWSASHGVRRQARRLAVGLIMAGTLLIVVQPEIRATVLSRASAIFDFETGTGGYRRRIVEEAVADMEWRDVLIGLGVNSFSHRHENPYVAGEPAYLSSMPLAVIYDTGLVGAAFLVAALRRFDHGARAANTQRQFRLLLLVALVCSLATNGFWFAFVWIPLVVLAGTRRIAPSKLSPA